MQVEKLAAMIDKIIECPGSPSVVILNPDTGESVSEGRFVVAEGSLLRIEGAGWGSGLIEMYLGKWLRLAGCKGYDGCRDHTGDRGYVLNVDKSSHVIIRRSNHSWWFIGLAIKRDNQPAAENLAAQHHQPGYFKLGGGTRFIPRKEYADYRLNREPTLDTGWTNLQGENID